MVRPLRWCRGGRCCLVIRRSAGFSLRALEAALLCTSGPALPILR